MTVEDRDAELAGVRFAGFLLDALPFWGGGALALGLAGLLAGLVFAAPFTVQSTIKIGLLAPKQPTESPTVAISHLRAHGRVAATRHGGSFDVFAEKGRHHPRRGALVQFNAYADTPERAHAIADEAVTALLERHRGLHDHEEVTNQQLLTLADGRVKTLLAQVAREQANTELSDALGMAREDAAGMALMGSVFAAPRSQRVQKTEAKRSAPRPLIFGLAGILLGGLLGMAFAIARRAYLRAQQGNDDDLGTLVMFYRRRAPILLAATIGVGLLAAVAGKLTARSYLGTVTLQSARVAPNPSFEHVSVTQLRLTEQMNGEIKRQCLEGCRLDGEIIPLRDALADRHLTDVVRVMVKGDDPILIKRTLESVRNTHISSQRSGFERAFGVWRDKVGQLDADLTRLVNTRPDRIDQAALLRVGRERATNRRYLNGGRSWPPRVLVPIDVRYISANRRTLLALVAGSILGLAVGIVLAFVQAAWQLRRRR